MNSHLLINIERSRARTHERFVKVSGASSDEVQRPLANDTNPASPLHLEGWLEFNQRKFGVTPHRISLGSFAEQGPALASVLYLDMRGRVRMPWRNPYVPIAFRSTPTPFPHRVERQWHELAAAVVDAMRKRGVINQVHLPPSIQDVRPWQWAGFQVHPRYTFVVDFPFRRDVMSKQVRARIRHCERDGYRVERTTDMAAIFSCIKAAELRNNYNLGLQLEDLLLARSLLGDDHLIGYVGYSPQGDPASATLNLHVPGTTAVGWIGGTKSEYLTSGIADLVEAVSYDGLAELDATGLDLCGANLPGVAAYKSSLGARLVPYYSIEGYSPRRLARWVHDWWRFQRANTGEEGDADR